MRMTRLHLMVSDRRSPASRTYTLADAVVRKSVS
jgi:hypothetical protein